jgi:hypothetical protein
MQKGGGGTLFIRLLLGQAPRKSRRRRSNATCSGPSHSFARPFRPFDHRARSRAGYRPSVPHPAHRAHATTDAGLLDRSLSRRARAGLEERYSCGGGLVPNQAHFVCLSLGLACFSSRVLFRKSPLGAGIESRPFTPKTRRLRRRAPKTLALRERALVWGLA